MEWIVGIFILWLIGALSGGSSKSTNNSATTRNSKKKEDLQKANRESLDDLLKKFEIEVDGASNKKRKVSRPDVSVSLPPERQTVDEEPPPWDEAPPWLKDDSCSDISNAFNQYGVVSVWHMTHKNNVREILRSGILSNKTAYEIKNPIDISDHGVQRWRELEDPIYGRKLHEYAPTYINIKNPMLYVRRNIQHDLCLIEISLSALSDHNFIFTDGNAAARNTHFYNETSDLDKLPWDVLNASYWNDFPDGKRKRCSEVLIYPKIERKHITKLHCCSSSAYKYLSQLEVPVEISENLFF